MNFPNKKIKIIGYFIIGILFYLILLFINPLNYKLTPTELFLMFTDLVIIWIGVVLIMETGFFINKKLDVCLPWNSSISKRTFVQLIVQIVLVSFILFVIKLLLPELFIDVIIFRQVFITGVILSILFSTLFIAGSFFVQWNKATIKAAEYEKKVAQAELEFLKRQINPHFLFNNFSTLVSLIEENPSQAVKYVQQLSVIYRHILKEESEHLALLKDELTFIESYLFLYKIRYQENLIIFIDISKNIRNKKIATATLQLLVENSIKHNSISKQKPLKIEIFSEDDFIVVKNNINPVMNPVFSTGIGLRNISDRYKLLSKKNIIIKQDEDTFLVKVPLLY